MISGKPYSRIGLIALFCIFLLSIYLFKFSRNAIAAPGSLVGFLENLAMSPDYSEEIENVFFPVIFTNLSRIPFFGSESTEMLIESEPGFSQIVDLNVGWTRLNKSNGISWRKLQANPGDDINWDLLVDFENELRSLRKAGITPVVTLNDSPLWTVDPNARSDGQRTSCGPIHPDYYDEFANFLRKIINRYKAPEFDVHNWEIGNEPDVDPDLVSVNSVFGCWGDIDDSLYYGGKNYGEFLKYITPIIKSEDYSAKVWIGGLLLGTPKTTNPNLGKPERFLRGILEAGAGQYFDFLPYHGHLLFYGEIEDSDTHISGSWIELGGGILGKANYLRQIMKEYNVDKPLVLGEVGIGCRNDFNFCVPSPLPVFFQYQADMLIRVAVRTATGDIKGFSWYTISGSDWRFQRLLEKNYTPRPAYYAYQNLILRLENAKYHEPVYYGNDVEAYAFWQGNKKIHVIWTKEDKSVEILIPKSDFIDAFDRDGNQLLNPPSVDDSYKFTASFSPIFMILNP